MTDENDVRPQRWDLRGPAGATRTFTATDAPTGLVLHLGGEVGADGRLVDVDDLEGTTEITGPPWVVPFGEEATPLRWVLDGVVQSVGRLRPSRLGAPNPSATLALSTDDVSIELLLIGGEGGSGTVTSVAEVDPTSGDVPRAGLVAALKGTGSGDLAAGNAPASAVSSHAGGSGVHAIAGTTGLQAALDSRPHKVGVLVEGADLAGGSFSSLTTLAFGSLSRATLVGVKVAAVSGSGVGKIYTVTSSGACTEGATIAAGEIVAGTSDGLVAVATAPSGSVTGLTVAATQAALDTLDGDTTTALALKADADDVADHAFALANMTGAAQSPFAAWLHNGATDDDGTSEWLEAIEYAGLEGKAGSPYEGIPLMRPSVSTISGATPASDFTGVIYLTGQDTADHDGAHELFHTLESVGYEAADVAPGGILRTTYGLTSLVIGLFTTQTQTWNWGWIDPTDARIVDDVVPIGYEVLQAKSQFRVGGGSNAGLWVTTVDGIHGPAVPLADETPIIFGGVAGSVSDALDALGGVSAALDARLDALEAAVPPWSVIFGAGTAINADNTERTASTTTGPTVAAGDFIEFRHAWRYLQNSGAAASITVKVKVGSTALTLTAAPNMSSNGASRVAMLTGNIRVTGASAGQIEATLTVAGSAGAAAAGTTAIAETISGATLAVTTQLSSSHASHESQFIHGAMRLNPAA